MDVPCAHPVSDGDLVVAVAVEVPESGDLRPEGVVRCDARPEGLRTDDRSARAPREVLDPAGAVVPPRLGHQEVAEPVAIDVTHAEPLARQVRVRVGLHGHEGGGVCETIGESGLKADRSRSALVGDKVRSPVAGEV